MQQSLIRDLASRLRYLGVGSYVMYEILQALMTDDDPAFIGEIVSRSDSLGFSSELDSYGWSASDLPD